MKNALDLIKSAFEALKQVFIVVVLLCLLFYPSGVGQALAHMGITEGDVWGFKWKSDFRRTDERLTEAHAALAVTERQLAEAAARIDELTALIARGEPEDGPSVASAASARETVEASQVTLAEIAQTRDYANTTSARVERTLVQNAPLLARSEPQPGPVSGDWAVVAGGDRTLEAATDELRRARSAGFDTAHLVDRDGWIRTVILFPTRTDATQALPEIQEKMRRSDAYVVEMARWCPNPREVDAARLVCEG